MNKSRSTKLKLNIISSLSFQIITLICGFILPRLILSTYGSAVNGLVNSITQFLHIITFMELGVGAVVQSALYKPLADHDDQGISKIIVSANKFFNKIAIALVLYVFILIVIYPITVKKEFEWVYSAVLILAMSISTFSQYYFGVVDRLLLTADQKGYIQYTAQAITLILNTVMSYVLIKLGMGIHAVKISTSLIYLGRPIVLKYYVLHHYNLNRKIHYTEEPIKQKWNGIAQHVAAVVLDGTDNIVLTIFSTLSNVSIYSVYNLVVYGVKNLFLSLTTGMQALIGELWARKELDSLKKTFGWFEWLIHTGTIFAFGCTAVLVVPFVTVYTKGINDTNYIQPLFAVLITLAHAGHCLRLPYNIMILAGGHYKQTQSNYIVAVVLNISISILSVVKFGLIGVAIGTLIAMLYQTIWMAIYISRNLLKWPIRNFIKQSMTDIVTWVVAFSISSIITMSEATYFFWVIMAIKVVIVWGLTIVVVNSLLYKDKMVSLLKRIIVRFKR